jgi:hypothetical protein
MFPIPQRTLTLVMHPVESIDIDAMWNSVIDTVNETTEGNTTVKSEPIEGKITKKVDADLMALRVSP